MSRYTQEIELIWAPVVFFGFRSGLRALVFPALVYLHYCGCLGGVCGNFRLPTKMHLGLSGWTWLYFVWPVLLSVRPTVQEAKCKRI